MDNEEFWDTIEDWSENPTTVNAEFCGNTSFHEKIYEECKNYDNWTHSFSEDWPDDLKYNMATLSGADPSRYEVMKKKFYTKDSLGLKHPHAKEDWEYSSTVPHKEDFPTLHQFMEENPQYTNPVVTRMGSNDEVVVHVHGDGIIRQFLYNMSVNVPEDSKFAIYPDGLIPYEPGDIYKLYVDNNHAVRNGNETRYHVMFRGDRA